MASSDAKATAWWGVPHRIYFPIYDADGDLVTGASSLDTEISKDGGTFADATNEATEVATGSGVYFIDVTAAERECDNTTGITKTATAGAKTAFWSIYTEQSIRSNKAQAGATSSITLDSGASATDDYYNNTLIWLPTLNEARFITDYVGSTKVATVDRAWGTNPSSGTPFAILPAAGSSLSEVGFAVLDATLSGHTTAGTTGGQLNILPESLKKNTAFSNFHFAMFDSTTKLPVAGKTVTAERVIDGGTFAACANSVVEIANGLYRINLAGSDVNGNNMVTFRFTATGCDPTLRTVKVIP